MSKIEVLDQELTAMQDDICQKLKKYQDSVNMKNCT